MILSEDGAACLEEYKKDTLLIHENKRRNKGKSSSIDVVVLDYRIPKMDLSILSTEHIEKFSYWTAAAIFTLLMNFSHVTGLTTTCLVLTSGSNVMILKHLRLLQIEF